VEQALNVRAIRQKRAAGVRLTMMFSKLTIKKDQFFILDNRGGLRGFHDIDECLSLYCLSPFG
jgi:hypothetical protein